MTFRDVVPGDKVKAVYATSDYQHHPYAYDGQNYDSTANGRIITGLSGTAVGSTLIGLEDIVSTTVSSGGIYTTTITFTIPNNCYYLGTTGYTTVWTVTKEVPQWNNTATLHESTNNIWS